MCEQYLIGVIGGGAGALHTVSGHDRPQVIALHQELVLLLPTLLVDVDDSSGHLWDALHHHLDSETQMFEALQVPMTLTTWAASEITAAKRMWTTGPGVFPGVSRSPWGVSVTSTPPSPAHCSEVQGEGSSPGNCVLSHRQF